MSLGILITAYNERTFALNATIRAARVECQHGPIVVVDDASKIPVKLEPFSQLTLVRMQLNGGICRARNLGLSFFKDLEMVAIVNCDIILPSGWSRELASYLEQNPHVGAVWTGLRHESSQSLADWWLDCQELRLPPCAGATPFAPGHAVMFRRSALDVVGGYDELNHRDVNEDHDICRRLYERGLETHYLPHPPIKSLQQLSIREMARKDFVRMQIVNERRVIRCAKVLRKGGRRTVRHFIARKFNLIPLDIAVLLEAFRQIFSDKAPPHPET